MIKAVIFDMDGVLVDSEPVYQEATVNVLESLNIKATKEDLLKLAGGSSLHFNKFIQDVSDGSISCEDFNKICDQYYLDNPVKYEEIMFPHVRETLNCLKDNGYILALASSSKEYEIENVLKRCDLKDYFKLIISGEAFKESKPNPEIYLTCIKKLNLEANECVAVEDSEYGIKAAKGDGLICIAKKDDRFNYNQSMADYFIDDHREIIDILENLK